jgi:hypothetical protein
VSGEWGDSVILIINWKWIRARLGKVKMFSRFFQMSDSFLINLFHICLAVFSLHDRCGIAVEKFEED